MSSGIKFLLGLAVIIAITVSNWAMPTSVLYPVKIYFTEPIWTSAVSFLPKTAGFWQISLLSRRFAEARVLAENNRLDSPVKTSYFTKINSITAAAGFKAAELSRSNRLLDAASVQSGLEAVIQGYLASSNFITHQEFKALIKDATASISEISQKRLEYDSAILEHIQEKDVYVVLDSKLYTLENTIREVGVELDNNKDKMPLPVIELVTGKLDTARGQVEQARGLHNGEQSKYAFIEAEKAQREAVSARILVELRELYKMQN